MNVSASSQPAAPLITLEQCQQAVSEHPKAASLIIQGNAPETASIVTPSTFYDHFIRAIPGLSTGREQMPDQDIAQKSRQITKELFGLLRQEYGEKIAAASFPSAQHRIAIAHPLNTTDLDEILTTAAVLKRKGEDFSALESNPQIQALTQQVQVAEAKVDQTARAAQKKAAALNKKQKSAHLGGSVLRLCSLEAAEHTAHKKAIEAKDRLSIAYRNAFQKNKEFSSDTDSTSSSSGETTPLLSRKKGGTYYHAIS